MLTIKDFILDSCKSTPGFEYYPKKNKKINLDELKKAFEKSEEIYISKDNSPFYIHIKTKNGEVTIFSSLKIMVKDLVDEDVSNKIFNEIIKYINLIL